MIYISSFQGKTAVRLNLEKLSLNPGEGVVLKLAFDIDPASNVF